MTMSLRRASALALAVGVALAAAIATVVLLVPRAPQVVVVPSAGGNGLTVRLFYVDDAGSVIAGGWPPAPSDRPARSFYLVENHGEVHALEAADPSGTRCFVIWRADLQASERFPGIADGDRKGWFKGPCQGELYDLDGACVAGVCRAGDLRSFPATRSGSSIRIELPAPG